MFRFSLTLLMIVSLLCGGVPSVVCHGSCGSSAATSPSVTAGCCSTHQPCETTASNTQFVHGSGKCCCCSRNIDEQSEPPNHGSFNHPCSSNCSCCVLTTPLPVVVSRESAGSDVHLFLLPVDGVPFVDAGLLSGLNVPLSEHVRSARPPGNSYVPLNVRLCVWTV